MNRHRLPDGWSSSGDSPLAPAPPRVTIWRALRGLGASPMTPGAAILPFREELEEQLDWLAQEIEEQGGSAWVLPLTGLPEAEERRIREEMKGAREAEYQALRAEAEAFLGRADHPAPEAQYAERWRTEKELVAF